jgi:hypothetical protein
MPLKSRFDNPLELLLYAIPFNCYIFGSFVRHLCFDHSFHKTHKLSKECIESFLKSDSDIDLYIPTDEAIHVINILQIFGDVMHMNNNTDNTPGFEITKISWMPANCKTIDIDIIHNHGTDIVDFTANNWMLQKIKSNSNGKWVLKCRVQQFPNHPHLDGSAITTICFEDTLSKKINFVCNQHNIPKLVARTYKLLKKNFTFMENEMLEKFPVPVNRFKLKGRNKDGEECPICRESVDDKCAVLDCGHCMHPHCMQDYCVVKMAASYPFGISEEASNGLLECPMCRKHSSFNVEPIQPIPMETVD